MDSRPIHERALHLQRYFKETNSISFWNEEVQEGCFGMDTMTVFYGNEYMVIRKMMPVSSCCILKSLSLKERIL